MNFTLRLPAGEGAGGLGYYAGTYLGKTTSEVCLNVYVKASFCSMYAWHNCYFTALLLKINVSMLVFD